MKKSGASDRSGSGDARAANTRYRQYERSQRGAAKRCFTGVRTPPNGGVDQFIRFLADLPEGVSKLTKAQKLASDMSDQLIAKIAVNPLLNAPGEKRFLVTYLAPASVIDDWKKTDSG